MTGDILSVAIRADGWSADVTIEGFSTGAIYDFGLDADKNPTAATPYLTVVSEGFSEAGVLGTITRTVYVTSTVRKSFPDELSGSTGPGLTVNESVTGGNLVVRVALSEAIYDDDRNGGAGTSGTNPTFTAPAAWVTNTGGAGQTSALTASLPCTNNSTEDYPKPIIRWQTPPFQRVTGDFPVELTAFHIGARNAKPVACVLFDATDTSANAAAQQTATEMTLSPEADAKSVSVYSASIPVSALTQGQVVTVRARAYPWIGDTPTDTDTSADGVAMPSAELGPLPMLLDKANTLACYASVDGVGGSPAVAATPAAARFTPYSTVAAALTALKAFNNTNHADNSLNNCYLLMQNGSYTSPATFAAVNTKSWCVIQADVENGATEAGVQFTTAGGGAFNGYLKVQDVKIATASGNPLWGHVTTGALWMDSCTLSVTGGAGAYSWRAAYATRNTVTAFATGFTGSGTAKCPMAIFRGNDGTGLAANVNVTLYNSVGNKGGRFTPIVLAFGNTSTSPVSDNVVLAWNECGTMSAANWIGELMTGADVVKGWAIVCNVVEKTSTGSFLAKIAGDSYAQNSNHILLWHNTLVGRGSGNGRINVGYNDAGTTARTHRNYSLRYNFGEAINHKDDTFPTADAARGPLPNGYGTGYKGNAYYDAGSHLGEFLGIRTANSVTAGFTNNLATTGGGDYTLTETSGARNRIAAGEAVIPYDLEGNPYSNAGGGSAGAYQYAADVPAEDTPPTITSASTKAGQVGVPLSYTITATGTAPITYYAIGLPDWLTLDEDTGVITGTPTTAGVTVATITATNSAGEDSDTLTFTIADAPTPGPTSGNLSLFNQLAEAVGAAGGHRYNLDALNAISQRLTGSAGHTRNLAALNAIAGFYIGSTQSFTLNIDALNAITGKLGGSSNNTRTVDALTGWLGKL